MNRNRLPHELELYLDACEMNPHEMTDEEILEEARLVHYMHYEDGNMWNDEATPSAKAAVTRFINREEKRIGTKLIER